MKIAYSFIICLSVLLCGCAGNNNFTVPPAIATKSYTKEDNLLTPEQRVVVGKRLEVEWWSLFACEPLNHVIQQAIADNYDIAVAKSNLAQAEEAIKSQSGGFWPQVSLGGTAGKQKYGVALFGPSNISIPAFKYYEAGPSLSWDLDIFGSTRHSVERQQALAEYQAHNLDAIYIILTSNVVTQALEIAALKAEIAATKSIILEDDKTLQLVLTTFRAGSGTMGDILNAQSQLDNDRALLPPLKQHLSIAQHALAILVGKAPADWIAPDFDLAGFTLPKELPLSLPSELVRKRPDILAAEANLHAASAAIGIATANLYPSLVINADTVREALTPHGLLYATGNAWSIAANMTAPLFSGGTLTAEKRKAEHAYQATLAQYQQTILNAFKQVADVLTALANDADSVAIEQQAVTTANTWLEFAHKSYQAGAIGLLQIQDAQRKLARAQINLISVQRQRYLDTVQLFVALGGSPELPAALAED